MKKIIVLFTVILKSINVFPQWGTGAVKPGYFNPSTTDVCLSKRLTKPNLIFLISDM